ncbi:hypothetical protein LG329_11515 [Virgibacillus necropolis]|uniref:hypothetical protein n=1 Tax=Virgibacillus necropolis TaxID=163877 RepID=UPI00385179BF
MSLTTISTGNLVRKQFQYKMKAYIGVFSSLMVLQILAILFSLGGSGGSGGSGSHGISINVRYYSASIVVVFTMLWAFISAILITTKAYREDDFTFVTNRVTANLSNIVFLGTASIIGGVTAVLSGYLLKVVMYYVPDSGQFIGISSGPSPLELLFGLFATILFVFMFSSLGYLVGTLVQLHKIFVVVLPVVFFGYITFGEQRIGIHPLIQLGEFYFQETSFPLFLSKAVITIAILFTGSVLLSNRMEVRR